MFSRLLGFFVIAIAISNQACSQETTLNAFRRKPIVIPYKGEDLSVDEYLKTDAAIEHEKEKWWKVCDRQLRFSPLEFNELCNNFVGVKLITARSPIKINAIGFEAVPLVYDAHRKEWSEFAQSIRAQVVDQSLSDEKFFNFLLTLREDVSRFWKKIRTKDAPEVLCIQAELADHLSLIRKQNECWLTVAIEIVSDENNEGFFATELRKRLAPQQNRAIRPLADIPQRIEPHPMTEEDIETLIRKPRPLQANRSAIASKSVQNDKLTNLERASLYHFEVEDERNLQKHQIEGIGSRIAEDGIIRIIQEKMLEYTSERISHGTVLTYDELHLILGSVVQKVRGENGDFFTVKFTLAKLKYGTQNYTRIIAIAERK